MSLATIFYNINEVYVAYRGTSNEIMIQIVSAIIVAIVMYYLLKSGLYFKLIDKYFSPEAIILLSGIAVFDMLIMKDAYIFLLFLFLGVGFFYILFTNKKYETHKELLLYYLDKIL